MIERGGRFGFAAETFQGLPVLREFFGQEFQRDEASEAGVLGFIDHAHATAAQLFNDAVVRDGLVEHYSIRQEAAPQWVSAMLGGVSGVVKSGRRVVAGRRVHQSLNALPCLIKIGGYAICMRHV